MKLTYGNNLINKRICLDAIAEFSHTTTRLLEYVPEWKAKARHYGATEKEIAAALASRRYSKKTVVK